MAIKAECKAKNDFRKGLQGCNQRLRGIIGIYDIAAILLEKGMAKKAKDKEVSGGKCMAPKMESLDNLKGFSAGQMKAKFSQMRIPWPTGMEKGELAELLHEKLSIAAASQ
ncbi:hypothetical protein DUNSADRAFT_18621, partial [Dunaliella salina]